MYIPEQKSALECLIQNTPSTALSFFDGINNIRSSLTNRRNAGSTVIAPLRGAMPLVWASLGDQYKEERPEVSILEVPIGTFHYEKIPGTVQTTSPSYQQKRDIVSKQLASLFESNPQEKRLILLDEVQKGGTIATATRILLGALTDYDNAPRIKIIAAQDTRKKVVAQSKTLDYINIASNSYPHTTATVIPLPLITTDKAPLLDTICLEGDSKSHTNTLARITVIRNSTAERLMRGLGTMTREEEIRHDENYVQSLVESQGTISEKTSGRLEIWLPRFIEILDAKIHR